MEARSCKLSNNILPNLRLHCAQQSNSIGLFCPSFNNYTLNNSDTRRNDPPPSLKHMPQRAMAQTAVERKQVWGVKYY